MRIALCGNPNVGKTTIFNRLTRSDAPVGNWHGVTIDAREKKISGTSDVLIDLPGAYSLTARSKEETVTRDGILFGGYDAVVYVAEVNNLRRNLYLLTQIMETGARVVLVVNMMDEARGKVDLDEISRRLGIPVIGASNRAENPKAAVLAAVVKARPSAVTYATDKIVSGTAMTVKSAAARVGISTTFAALKVLEGDGYIAEKLGLDTADAKLYKCGSACNACAACELGALRDEPARLRYAYIDRVLDGTVEKVDAFKRTRKIDKIVLGRAALPIFLLVMALVFVITFEVARPLSELLSRGIELLKTPVSNANLPDWAKSLLCDGVIGGAGAVLAFLPQVVLLFLMTALLQDSGYMSRVAYVTDGFFKRFGLSGRAAFSMLLGLGCSATAVLSTRGIADKGARRRAVFAVPFVPCSARLAVFTAISAYLGLNGLAVAAMYVLGFCAALAVLFILRAVRPTDGEEALLMEMPPYRIPSFKRTVKAVFGSVLSFVTRVGSVVLGVGIITWVLSSFSLATGFTGGGETSIMSTFAGFIAPVFKPLGFGDWRAVAALLSGIAAKETLISVIASLGGMDAIFASKAAAVSFMIFSCLYVPCVATVAAIAKENGFRAAALSVAVHTVAAYIAALVYYASAKGFAVNKGMTVTVIACTITVVVVTAVVIKIIAHRRVTRGVKNNCGKT